MNRRGFFGTIAALVGLGAKRVEPKAIESPLVDMKGCGQVYSGGINIDLKPGTLMTFPAGTLEYQWEPYPTAK